MSKWNRGLALRLAFCGSLAIGAFGCASAQKDSPTAESQADREDELGPLSTKVLASINLSAEKTERIVTIRKELKAVSVPVRNAWRDVADVVATGVEKGQLDKELIEKRVDALFVAIKANEPSVKAALQNAHNVLDATERRALVDAMKARRYRHSHHEPREHREGREGREGHKSKRGVIAELLAAIGLTDLQRDAFKALRGEAKGEFAAEREAARKRLDALGEDFVKDDFDSNTADVEAFTKLGARERVTKAIAFVDRAISILGPSQRETAAKLVRANLAR